MTITHQISSDSWNVRPRPSIKNEFGAQGQTFVSLGSKHFYLTAGRPDDRFRVKPEQPSFQVEPNKRYHVTIDIETHGNIAYRFSVIDYDETSDQVQLFTKAPFTFQSRAETTSVTLAIRAIGTGSIKIGETTVRELSLTQELSPPPSSDKPKDGDFQQAVFDLSGITEAELTVQSVCSSSEQVTAALVSVEFTDEDGRTVLSPAEFATNPNLGSYFPISHGGTEKSPAETVKRFNIPKSARFASVKFHQWKKSYSTRLMAPIQLNAVNDATQLDDFKSEETIQEFVDQIPKDDVLIVLYTTAPALGHTTLALRPNRMAKEFSDLGLWVVFFPFSTIKTSERHVDKRVRQFNRSDINLFITAARRRHDRNNVFICSSFPDITAVTTIDTLRQSKWQTMYEVRDDMEEFNRVGYSKWFHPQLERRVCQSVDNIITVSPRLARKMEILRGGDRPVTVIPNAVSRKLIELGQELRDTQGRKRRSFSVKIGYLGHLTPSWFDWKSVILAAQALPEYTFELAGHGTPANIKVPENITLLGPKTHEEFAELAKDWKIGLIPFKPSTLTFAVDPNKVYEYLAVGLRVVTAEMGAVRSCPSTYVYTSASQFIDCLKIAMNTEVTNSEAEETEKFLTQANWPARAKQMCSVMGFTHV